MTKVTKTKKLLAAALCLALLFSLAMCGRSCISGKASRSEEQEKESIRRAVRASMDALLGNSGKGILSYEITDVQISDASAIATVKIAYLDESEAVNKGTDEYIAKVLGGEAESDELHKACIEEARKTTDPKEVQKEGKINASKKDDSWKVEVLPEDITNAADGDIEITKRVLSKKVETAIGTTNEQSPSDQQTPAAQPQQPTQQTNPQPQQPTQQEADPQQQTPAVQPQQPQEQQTPTEPPKEDPKPAHVHEWVDITETVHHKEQGHYEDVVVEPAWDEDVYEAKLICKGPNNSWSCGLLFDTTDEVADHIEWDHDGNGSWTTTDVLVDTIHHEAVVKQQWVVTQEAYDEEVTVGQRCSICGETK